MDRRILQIRKILNNKTPSYLKDKLAPNCRALFNGNTRNTFRQIICKSNRYMNSFFPDAVVSWNIFIKHFDDVPSFDLLQNHINTFFRPKTKHIFGIHDPSGLRYLFQLKMSLRPLKSHKFRHNFADTPSEICRCHQGIEDTNHFLFSCPAYATPRTTLAASVTNRLQKFQSLPLPLSLPLPYSSFCFLSFLIVYYFTLLCVFCVNFFFLIKVLCCIFSRICRGFGLISLPSRGSVFYSRKENP